MSNTVSPGAVLDSEQREIAVATDEPRSTDEIAYLRQLLHDLEFGEKSVWRGRMDITNGEIGALKGQIAALERLLERQDGGVRDP
jgi:hypothetical protein